MSGTAKVPSDLGRQGLSKASVVSRGKALSACTPPGHVPDSSSRPTVAGWSAMPDPVCPADPAKITGLTSAFTSALRRLRARGTGHAPGRVAVDLAVMLADGGETITDFAVLCDRREVFGPVAAPPTARRLLADIGPPALAALREARATARDIAWLQAADTRDGIPASRAGGRGLPCLVPDLDAPWSSATPRRSRQSPPTSAASATTRCCASCTTSGPCPTGSGTRPWNRTDPCATEQSPPS